MSRASRQLPDRNELFRLNHLRLNVFEIFERMVRSFEQSSAVAVYESLAHKRKRGNDQQGDLRHADAKCSDAFAIWAVAQAPQRHDRDGYHGRHSYASGPSACFLFVARHRVRHWLALIGNDSS